MRRYDNKNSQEHTQTASEQSTQLSIEHKQVEEEPRGIEDYLDNNTIIERNGYNMLPNALHTPHTILVLENDERLSRPTQKNLTRSGFHTALVSNGAEAITWIANNPVTLLLMNYRLPDMSVKKFLHTLTDRNLSVPFITMIEQGDEKAAIEMMKLGTRDFLVKDSALLDILPLIVNRTMEQLAIERRLHEAEEALKRSVERYHNLIKFANVGGVTHNFNNVLAAILGRVQLAKAIMKSPQGEKERRKAIVELNKSMELVEKAALDGAEMVRRIQEFSRRRNDDKYFAEVDLNKVIGDALEFTKVRWKNQAEAKGIKIKIKKDLSPLVSIAGNNSDLREAFINIINNAIDAMPHGGNIIIQTFQEDSQFIAQVKDTGVGIPEVIWDTIFDPFFTTKGVESTGLGLSVSYGIITRHRGTIMVDSTEGQGTTFSIRLPISENIIKENKPQPISRTQRKARILVIEDEKEVRELLYDILTGGSHEVETAPNGREGMKIFKKGMFDLVFTDLGMPGMTGLQVAEAIKKTNTKTPVILITGWELQLKDSELKKSGINLVVNKPFKVEQVLRLVQECEKKAISKAKSEF